jgi:hypothetical protein
MVRCLEQLDYPKDQLEALILVERRDEATKQAIRDAGPAGFIRIVEIPPGKPQTKPLSAGTGSTLILLRLGSDRLAAGLPGAGDGQDGVDDSCGAAAAAALA